MSELERMDHAFYLTGYGTLCLALLVIGLRIFYRHGPFFSLDPDLVVNSVFSPSKQINVLTVFACHYPLGLSPDMIWLCIMQGLSIHVNKNAEKLKSKFVSHEGKVEIVVRRDDFVKGQQNSWQEVFSDFSAQIQTL